MRILRIIWSLDPKIGGPAQGLRNMLPELERFGVISEVVTFDEPNSNWGEKLSCVIHPLGKSISPWYYNLAFSDWLSENLHRFDSVIVHGMWLYTGFATRRAVEKMRHVGATVPRFYVYPHGMLDPWFQKLSVRFLKSVRNWIYWKFIESKIINEADGILFTCDRECELARTSFTPYSPREIVVGYGIPEPPHAIGYSDKETNLASQGSYLLFLSRLDHKKGLDILLRGYAELVNSGFDMPDLIIAGAAGSSFALKMQKLSMELTDIWIRGGKTANIKFVGLVRGSDKWNLLRRAEAFILPSHQENFGISVVEALACEVPVLISDQVNIFDTILSNGAGLIAQDSLDGVKSLLKRWVEMSYTDRSAMAKAALKCYRENFAVDVASKKLVSFLESDLS